MDKPLDMTAPERRFAAERKFNRRPDFREKQSVLNAQLQSESVILDTEAAAHLRDWELP